MAVFREYYPYPRDKRLFELAKNEIVEKVPIPIYIMDNVDRTVDLYSDRKMCCPMHTEDTPSFVFVEEQQKWTCYGSCSTSGKVIDLHQKLHGIKNYYSALMHLKDMYGKRYGLTFKNFFIYDGNPDITIETVLSMASEDEETKVKDFSKYLEVTESSPHLMIKNIENSLALLKTLDLEQYIKYCIKYDSMFSYHRADTESLAEYTKELKGVVNKCKQHK